MSRPRHAAPYVPGQAPTQYDPGFINEQLHQLSRALELLWPVNGEWTPAITFATPGDLSVAYSPTPTARFFKRDKLVLATFQIVTSAFTHTTASGQLRITGLPFDADSFGSCTGALDFSGITKAGYTNYELKGIASSTSLQVLAGGSGVASATIVAADMPTGGTVRLVGSISYLTA